MVLQRGALSRRLDIILLQLNGERGKAARQILNQVEKASNARKVGRFTAASTFSSCSRQLRSGRLLGGAGGILAAHNRRVERQGTCFGGREEEEEDFQ